LIRRKHPVAPSGDNRAVSLTLACWALLVRFVLLGLVLATPLARAEPGPLRVEPRWDAPLTGAAAVVALALASPYAAPAHCEICGSGRLDDFARERLMWRNPAAARLTSDIVANGVLPAAVLLNSAWFARESGEPSVFWMDALVMLEAVALTTDLNGVSKDAFARRRPSAGDGATGGGNRSFFSGHTSFAFALATSAGTIGTLRGYPSAPWVWAGGIALATGVGYLRVAGDAHWLTDVATGAAVGGLVGFAVPWVFHRVNRVPRSFDVVASAGGVAILF